MDNAGVSSHENIASLGSDVCQGLGDMQDPRWFLVERESDFSYLCGPYIYTYVHHASIEALAASADGGYATCATIGDALWGLPSAFSTESADLMLVGEPAQPDSKTHAVQLDDEAMRARKLT